MRAAWKSIGAGRRSRRLTTNGLRTRATSVGTRRETPKEGALAGGTCQPLRLKLREGSRTPRRDCRGSIEGRHITQRSCNCAPTPRRDCRGSIEGAVVFQVDLHPTLTPRRDCRGSIEGGLGGPPLATNPRLRGVTAAALLKEPDDLLVVHQPALRLRGVTAAALLKVHPYPPRHERYAPTPRRDCRGSIEGPAPPEKVCGVRRLRGVTAAALLKGGRRKPVPLGRRLDSAA